jgi:hypothetical protein
VRGALLSSTPIVSFDWLVYFARLQDAKHPSLNSFFMGTKQHPALCYACMVLQHGWIGAGKNFFFKFCDVVTLAIILEISTCLAIYK